MAAKPKKVITDEAKNALKVARMLLKYPSTKPASCKPLIAGPERLTKVLDAAKKTRDAQAVEKAKNAQPAKAPTTSPVTAPVTSPVKPPTMPTPPSGPSLPSLPELPKIPSPPAVSMPSLGQVSS